MYGWCGGASWPLWGYWWVAPLIGIVLCITMCLIFRSRPGGRHFCCWGGTGAGEFDEVKKTLQEMKEEIEKIKSK